ncbi:MULTISPECIES: hypothetical protein [unclassified Sinorhizobium]|uniref:hypothetical protein n=1 Tax=unclassified Sinorhizobium TaxID=2613772 RepID=UPI003526A69B
MRPQEADQTETDDELKREIEAVLAWHDEDARAAIAALLKDCRHLRHQLALAETAMSAGFTRGWAPSFERQRFEQPGSVQE